MPDDADRPLFAYRGFKATQASSAPPAHQPSRPSWACGVCGAEWPCPSAQEQLLTELRGTQLAMLMWTHLEHYALDAGPGPLLGAFDRFIRWTRA